MAVYFLNESSSIENSGDIDAFRSLERLGQYIELIDVEHGIYSVFDEEGNFYDIHPNISPKGVFKGFSFPMVGSRKALAQRLVHEFLRKAEVAFDPLASLEALSSELNWPE